MVGVGGHVMQRRAVVYVIGIVIETALTTLTQLAGRVVDVRQLHDLDGVLAIQVVHGACPHVTSRYWRRGRSRATETASWHRGKGFIGPLRISGRAEAVVDVSIWHAEASVGCIVAV